VGESEGAPPKVELALSGGGFRAAFFHVGVLARLAEQGVLRQVEVISTVSGGSIVGALYYLRLKELLESTPDGDPDDPDHEALDELYCDLVVDVEERLRKAVKKNLRARATLNLFKNFLMALPRYSRTDRMGDLYDRYLYKEAWGEERPRKWLKGTLGPEKQIELNELRMTPWDRSGTPVAGFHPDTGNASRAMKVPALLINASTLNTGHDWRFEAIRMGEPETGTSAVDGNETLLQGYLDPAYPTAKDALVVPEECRDFPLALAVAASAAVPGIFNPLAISDLYEDIRVELVDGGVQDNQGVRPLLEDSACTHVIASDASHQMSDQNYPATTAPATLGRSMSIAGDRVRDQQMSELEALPRPAVMDLRKGLTSGKVPPSGNTVAATSAPVLDLGWGVTSRVQALLAEVRTDLDYFSDIEASALELDGYLMADHSLGGPTGHFADIATPVARRQKREWLFEKQLGELFKARPDPPELIAHLEVAKSKFLRPLQLPGALSVLLIGLASVLAIIAVVLITPLGGWIGDAADWAWPPPNWLRIAVVATAVLTLVTYAGSGSRPGIPRTCAAISGFLIPAILAVPAWIWAQLQVRGGWLRSFSNTMPALPPKPPLPPKQEPKRQPNSGF
jgi:NTE family protein